MIDKYPFKKILALDWYEAAIGHLLFFKSLKERMNNNVYFLISEKGILLKAATSEILKQSEQQVNRFFTAAHIQQLEITQSASFYQKLLQDIKALTNKLKNNKDCPYVNLVYSEKIKQSCLALKRYGYNKPYEIWEQWERDKKGFCFLIVRPDYRWKEISNAVYNLVKKRESTMLKPLSQTKTWTLQIPYQKFLWLYLRKQFKDYKDRIEVKEKRNEQMLTITVSQHLPFLSQLEKQIDYLNYAVRPEIPANLYDLIQHMDIQVIPPIELQKLTEVLYHEFGISHFVKKMRNLSGYLLIGTLDLETWLDRKQQHFRKDNLIQGLHRIPIKSIQVIHILSSRTQIVEYEGFRYLCRQVNIPLKTNIKNAIKSRLPCLAKYIFYYENSNGNVFLLRNYYIRDFSSQLQACPRSLDKVLLLHTVAHVLSELHSSDISVGKNFSNGGLYMEGYRVVADCSEETDKLSDLAQFAYYLRSIPDYFIAADPTEKMLIDSIVKEANRQVINLQEIVILLDRFKDLFN